jgi:hypothetical protein
LEGSRGILGVKRGNVKCAAKRERERCRVAKERCKGELDLDKSWPWVNV